MADDSGTTKDQPDFTPCGVTCGATGCSRTCCKDNTPAHQSYGIHACSDHK